MTRFFGKFHLGSAQPDSLCKPPAMGFDEWCIGLDVLDNDPYLSCNGNVEHREGRGSVLLVDDTLEPLNRHKDGGAPLFTVVWFPSPHDPHDEQPEVPTLYEARRPNEVSLARLDARGRAERQRQDC